MQNSFPGDRVNFHFWSTFVTSACRPRPCLLFSYSAFLLSDTCSSLCLGGRDICVRKFHFLAFFLWLTFRSNCLFCLPFCFLLFAPVLSARPDSQTRLSRVHVLGYPTSGKSTLIQLFRQLQNECGNIDSQRKSQEHLSPVGSKLSIGSSNPTVSNANGREDSSDAVFLHLQESNLDLLHSKQQQSNETLNGVRSSNGCLLQPHFDSSNDSGYLDVDSNSPFANYPADLYMVVYAVNDRWVHLRLLTKFQPMETIFDHFKIRKPFSTVR